MRTLKITALILAVSCFPLQAAELLGWIGCDSMDVEVSIRECTLIIEKEKDKDFASRAFFFRGESHRRAGENDLAIADYRSALRLDPRYADAYQRLAIVRMHKAQFQRKLTNYLSKCVSN